MIHRTAVAVHDRICVGIDLHKDKMMICVLDPRTGEVQFRKIACKCRKQIAEFFASLSRPHVVAIEAVGFYRWLWDLLEPIVDKLQLADAVRCRALAASRPKTDKEDAFNVADLLAAGRLPIAYAPPAPVRELRDWTRHRNGLSRAHARVIHRVQSVMNANNRPGPKRMVADTLIRYLKAHESLLSERHMAMLWQAVDQLALVERQVALAERAITKSLQQPRFAALDELLRTAPGVGFVTSATVMAEIGDFGRFTVGKKLVRYAGLNPRTFESADKQRGGAISKAGPRQMRWVLIQAAWVAVRGEGHLRRHFGRLCKRMNKKKAIVAIARKLLLCLWVMARAGKPYRAPGGADTNPAAGIASA